MPSTRCLKLLQCLNLALMYRQRVFVNKSPEWIASTSHLAVSPNTAPSYHFRPYRNRYLRSFHLSRSITDGASEQAINSSIRVPWRMCLPIVGSKFVEPR
jgi:hypothetical protein